MAEAIQMLLAELRHTEASIYPHNSPQDNHHVIQSERAKLYASRKR